MLLVSACLAGVNCTFTGRNNLNLQVIRWIKGRGVIPVCPEQLGGLSTPRPPAEIRGGIGVQVLSGEAAVFTSQGEDVTQAFLDGAEEVLKLARFYGITGAILKEGSPSCGSCRICDGSFTGTRIPGTGVTTALLEKEGIRVFSENAEGWVQQELNPAGRERLYIGVIGAASAHGELLELAYQVGGAIADRGAVLLCGGRGGVMAAAAKGVRERGGLAVGILPGEEKREGNPYLDISLATGLGDARNAVLTRTADGLIAIGGAYGTLSEIGLALKMGKQVVGLKTWQLVNAKGEGAHIETASSPEEAVSLVLSSLDE